MKNIIKQLIRRFGWLALSVIFAHTSFAATSTDTAIATTKFQGASTTAASATCLSFDSDRIYGDQDCDNVKDSGEEYVDIAAGAPIDATYITQTSNATLTGEQALSTLSTGIMRVATTTGAVTSLTDSAGIAANISDESGTGVIAFTTSPVFTTPNIGSATGSISGNAGTATALASNGSNCSSGSFPLGVDASGAVESCTDAVTQAEGDATYLPLTGGTLSGALTVNNNNGAASTLLTIGDANDADSVQIYGDLTVTGGDITLGTTSIFSGGDTASLNNIDAIDATTETTLEAAIDALANLTTTGTITSGTWNAGAVTSSGKIIGNASLDVKNGATSSGVLAIFEDSDDGTNKATFQVPALSADTVYILPSNDGDASQVLQTNGSGTLSWATVASGSGWTDNGTTINADNNSNNYVIGSTSGTAGTSATATLVMAVGTTPSTSPADSIQIFAQDIASGYGADVTSGETFTASATHPGSSVSYAFDDNASNYWNPSNGNTVPQWIKVQYASAKTIQKITVNWFETKTYTYTFEGSNDNSAWTTLLTKTAASYTDGVAATETFTNSTAYTYYRMTITATGGGTYLILREMEMMEASASTAEARVRDEGGNVTTFSPHNFGDIPSAKKTEILNESDGLGWTYHSEKNGESITVDMFGAIRELERTTGKKFIYHNSGIQPVDRTVQEADKTDFATSTFKNMTPAEAEAWVEANVTNIATAKVALKKMAKVLMYLVRRSDLN